MKHERIMKRNLLGYLFAVTLALTMLLGFGITVAAADGEGTGKTILAFSSDVHNGYDSSSSSSTRFDNWLNVVKGEYGEGKIDVIGFCGDMGPASGYGDSYWNNVQNFMKIVDGHAAIKSQTDKAVYTTGNHEYMNGQYDQFASNAQRQKINFGVEGREGSNYRIYCLGSESSSSNYSSTQITALSNYLKSAGNDKPIFILTHFPLHYYRGSYMNRTTGNAKAVIELLNKATEDYNQTIVLLWGHNHTEGDTHYDNVYRPGAGLNYDGSNIAGIKFIYAAAGAMADEGYGQSQKVLGKGLIVTIDGDNDNALDFTYYDKSGNKLNDIDNETGDGKPSGDQGGSDPVIVPEDGDITITPSTSNPEQSVKIKKGDEFSIIVENGSNNSAYDFSVSLSNSSVATVTPASQNIAAGAKAAFKVTGVTDGTVDITIKNNQSSSQYVRRAVVHLTVGEGGGENPPATQSTRFEETDHFEDGGEYIMATGDGTEVTAFKRVSNNAEIGTTPLTVKTSDGINYIETEDKDVVWTRQSDGLMMNNGQMFYPTSAHGIYNEAPGQSNIVDRPIEFTSMHKLKFVGSNQGDYANVPLYVVYPVPSSQLAATEEEDGTTFRLFKRVDEATPPVETKIELDQTELNLKVGEEATLKATVTPDTVEILDWDSSDVSVATVSSLGEVKAVAEGTAKITVKTADGKEAYCDVTVTPVTKIELDQTELNLKVGEEATLKATVTPDTVEIDNWDSSEPTVAEVSDGKVTAIAEGTTKITVTTKDGVTAECTVTVTKKDEGQGGDTPGGNTPGGNTPGGTTPSKSDTKNTSTVDPSVQPTADQIAKAKVNGSLPVIDMDKIKTVASAKKATMTIGLGKMDADYCQIEYRKAGDSKWTSAWVKPSNEVTLKNMKKKSYYQFRFTTFKVVNGEWQKSKTSNISYRWILNTKVKKVKAKGKTATVKWAKVKGAKGYWVQYSTDKTFVKNAKVVKINKAKATSKKIKGLKKGKTYYVRVRPITKKSGKTYLGIYSGYKKFKVKKK